MTGVTAKIASTDEATLAGDLTKDIVSALGANMTQEQYKPLYTILHDAYSQAANGKGKARHNGRGVAFDRQPIMEIGRMCGLGYPTGQAQKKTQEAVSMFSRGEGHAAEAELLGAINYLAAAVMLIRERRE